MRILLLAVLTVFITSCGFSPVYTTNTSSDASQSLASELSQIAVPQIPNKEGVDLRNALIDKLYIYGEPDTPLYVLPITFKTIRIKQIGLARDATTTREQISITVKVELKDVHSGETLKNREFTALTNYNILRSEYATTVAREEAQQRALEQISEDIMTFLSLYFS